MLKRYLKLDVFFFIASFIISLGILSGCGTQQVLVQTEYKAVLPEDHLIADCPVEMPPTKKAYLGDVPSTANFNIGAPVINPELALLNQQLERAAHREKLLYDFAMAQTKNIQLCNKDKKALRGWKAKTKQAVETGPPKTTKRE